jgi:Ca-activated chloride channel family protein
MLALTVWLRWKTAGSAWESMVDPALQPYVIENRSRSRRFAPLLLFAAWALTLLLLAGPVWQQREVPVFQAEQAEIILFDLSRSMRADDIAPDRLTRARYKLIDLLRRAQGQQTGLVAFAERPYIISPLSEDAQTIESFVPSLEPSIMPVQGSRPDLAIDRAVQLFEQSAVPAGHIILITDVQAGERDFDAARVARDAGHRLSVLAVGTAAGAPLRDVTGQFVQSVDGAVVVPQLDFTSLSSLATAGGGTAVRLSSSNDDLLALESVRRSIAITADSTDVAAQKIYWIEYSPWLLWLLVPSMLLAFRRGVAA